MAHCLSKASTNSCLVTQVGPDMPSLDGDGTDDRTEVNNRHCPKKILN